MEEMETRRDAGQVRSTRMLQDKRPSALEEWQCCCKQRCAGGTVCVLQTAITYSLAQALRRAAWPPVASYPLTGTTHTRVAWLQTHTVLSCEHTAKLKPHADKCVRTHLHAIKDKHK